MAKPGWCNARHNNEVHTVPVDDLVAHTFTDCACGPKVIPVELDNGGINWQIVHEALDGRE